MLTFLSLESRYGELYFIMLSISSLILVSLVLSFLSPKSCFGQLGVVIFVAQFKFWSAWCWHFSYPILVLVSLVLIESQCGQLIVAILVIRVSFWSA